MIKCRLPLWVTLPLAVTLWTTLLATPAPKVNAQAKEKATVGLVPLTELSRGDTYKGEDGGLYGGGKNEPPDAHQKAAAKESARIAPLDDAGNPARDGKIGLVSISMSNATQEFSFFKKIADADADRSPRVAIVDCAQGGQAMAEWVDPKGKPWAEADRRLKAANVSPQQVQIAWIKLANKGPSGDLAKHGKKLYDDTLAVLHNAKARFPNLRIAYLGSRIYGGYAVGPLNPEPYAYEGAFPVRWLIRDQVKGDAALNFDPARGAVKSPVLLWGPYLWADGVTPRKSDGLVWERKDFATDGVHPTASGRQKVADMLLKFFKTDPLARTWFVRTAQKKARGEPVVTFPPTLPAGQQVVTDTTEAFLKAPATLRKDVAIAKTPPTVDFLYYPGQTYEGKPWSNWGDSLAVNGKYSASIGDHLAIGRQGDTGHGTGTAFVYEYDPDKKTFRLLADVAKVLGLPKGHYTPGKIHGRLDLGADGWLYFSTHRGSTTVTTDRNHYKGDWILRCDPKSGRCEVVAQGPVPKHCIPTSVLDPSVRFIPLSSATFWVTSAGRLGPPPNPAGRSSSVSTASSVLMMSSLSLRPLPRKTLLRLSTTTDPNPLLLPSKTRRSGNNRLATTAAWAALGTPPGLPAG